MSEISTIVYNGQRVISHRECARVLKKRPDNVLRDIRDLEKSMKRAGIHDDFLTNFFFIDADNDFASNLRRNKNSQRGQRQSKHYLITQDGFFHLASKYTTNPALVYKNQILKALRVGEYLATKLVPELQAEIQQLKQERTTQLDKSLRGPPAGTIRTPRMQVTLWDTVEVINYEMKPKNKIDPHLLALSKLDLYHNMQRGLTVKVGEQLEILIKETAKDRAAVHQLADARFYCDDSKGNK